MDGPATINPRIVDALYCEALVLSDDVRAAFDFSGRIDSTGDEDARIALSCEALRTTTRMMHSVAWLLNHRAYFAGDLSEFQLRRYGRLSDFPLADPDRLAQIEPEVRELIGATERFHARLLRLDRNWREASTSEAGTIAQMREAIGRRFGG